MRISCEFKDWTNVVQFVRNLPSLGGANSPLTVIIKRIYPGGFYAVNVTDDSDGGSKIPPGSDLPQIILTDHL